MHKKCLPTCAPAALKLLGRMGRSSQSEGSGTRFLWILYYLPSAMQAGPVVVAELRRCPLLSRDGCERLELNRSPSGRDSPRSEAAGSLKAPGRPTEDRDSRKRGGIHTG